MTFPGSRHDGGDAGAPAAGDSAGKPGGPAEGYTPFILRGSEGRPTGERIRLTVAQEAARKRRNLVIAGSLVGFIVLVFLVTVLRLSQNIAAGG